MREGKKYVSDKILYNNYDNGKKILVVFSSTDFTAITIKLYLSFVEP